LIRRYFLTEIIVFILNTLTAKKYVSQMILNRTHDTEGPYEQS